MDTLKTDRLLQVDRFTQVLLHYDVQLFQRKKIILPPLDWQMALSFLRQTHPLQVSLRSHDIISHQKFLSEQFYKIHDGVTFSVLWYFPLLFA